MKAGILWACQIFVVGNMNPVEMWGWLEGRKPVFAFENINGKHEEALGSSAHANWLRLLAVTWWGTQMDLFLLLFSALWKDFILKTFYLFCLRIPELVPELMFSIVLSFDIWHLYIYIENLCSFSNVICCSHFIVIFGYYINKCTFH